ncbi:MAG: hypothetical protein ABJI60_20190 [Kangiellaceae bacterium]
MIFRNTERDTERMSFEDFALKVLNEDLGLEAEKIDEGQDETPDFIALDGNYIYYIELKERDSSEEYLRERELAFGSDDVYSSTVSLEKCRNTSKVINKAKNQLKAESAPEEIRIVWLHAHGSQREALVEKFLCTLYGKADIYDWAEGRYDNKDCYYFDHSDFFRYRDSIDGAIISLEGGMAFAINNFSPKYDILLESEFTRGFSKSSLINPIQLESEGKVWLIDCDLDRKDEDTLLNFLIDKYSLGKPRRIVMQQAMVEFSIPHKN